MKQNRETNGASATATGQVWKSYYFQGATRLAMRVQVNGVEGKVYYLTKNKNGYKQAGLQYASW